MGQYSDAILQEIRTRTDIVDLVGQYVPLRRAGVNLKGLCPFHKEKSPSFLVHPEKQIYRCFGCGASGNVFGFLMQYEGMSFPEAVRMLAEKSGVKLEASSGPAGPSKQLTERLKQIYKSAAALYSRLLLKEREGEAARAYLKSRGLELGVAQELGLGFAPESWDFLKNALARQGFEISELEQSGLIKKADEANRFYDRFRNRLMFPILDPYGVLIAFGGRTLGSDSAKYINSPESPIYHKGHHLFGIHWARDAAREAGCLVLVEGNFDCVLPWSRGVRNVVASLGTSLTQSHVRLMKRYTDRVILLFDQDEAGQASQRKAAELLIEEGLQAQIATLDRHKDPADYVLHEGGDALRRRLSSAVDAVAFYAARALEAGQPETPRAKAKAAQGVISLIEKIVDPVEKSESLRLVARELGIDERVLRQELKGEPAPASPAPAAGAAPEKVEELEERLLRSLVARPDLFVHFMERHDPGELQSQLARELIGVLSELYSDQRPAELSELLARLASEAVRQRVTAWVFEAQEFDAEEDFHACLAALHRRKLRNEQKDLSQKMKRADQSGDAELQKRLLLESILLAKEKHAEVHAPVVSQPQVAAPKRLRLKAPDQSS